jgi:DNA-binding MarR family transcriptional regulator
VADSSDRRACRVRLTPAGTRAFRSMAAEHERWIIEAFSGFAARDQRRLAGDLAKLKTHVRNR